MLNDRDILEAATFAPSGDLQGSRYKVRLIQGDVLGSSGYYPAEMLRRDGPSIFKKGTPMFIDHQTPQEKADRPFGSVSTFVGELAEDAYYENDGLYSDIEVFEHHRPMIKGLKDRVGISIRAKGKVVMQAFNGKNIPVFRELTEARSADFVVRAGAGGKIVSILESAQDSEADSDNTESEESMDEVLEALKGLETRIDTRLTQLEESAKAPVVEEKPVEESETVVDYDKVLEIAEALGASKLSAEGRARVLDLHKANGKPLAELITAEEAYVKDNTPDDGEQSGEVEESAGDGDKGDAWTLPSAWNKKGNK